MIAYILSELEQKSKVFQSNEVFPENFPNLNRQYTRHAWGMDCFQKQDRYRSIDDWSYRHPKLRFSRLKRRSYLSGSTNTRDVYCYQDLKSRSVYYDGSLDEFLFFIEHSI